MKNKNTMMIVLAFLLLVLGSIAIYKNVENKNNNQNNLSVTDNEKFAREYREISEDNVFVYRNIEQIIKIMENGTGVIYLGFPECPWCQNYVKYLNEVAKEVGIDKIYYYNIYEDRKNETANYKKIVSLLKANLQYDDEGNLRVYVPNVSFHVYGKVIGNDFETSLDTLGFKNPEEYWTQDRITNLKQKLTAYMNVIKSETNMCIDCNK